MKSPTAWFVFQLPQLNPCVFVIFGSAGYVSDTPNSIETPRFGEAVVSVRGPEDSNKRAESVDQSILNVGKKKAWELENIAVRAGVLIQAGRGYQSQAGPPEGPGSEKLIVFQPLGSLSIRQGLNWRHDVQWAIDIVTAASPDAIDATTSASRENEAGEAVVTSSVKRASMPKKDSQHVWSLSYGFHFEEHWRTGIAGLGFQQGLFADSTTFSANILGIYDNFDAVRIDGDNDYRKDRGTIAINGSWTQILSAVNLASVSYGFTYQAGTLENTWNSVPIRFLPGQMKPSVTASVKQYRYPEVFPDQRERHAVAIQFAQHIPRTRSSIHLGYRYYRDDFGLSAHSGEVKAFQYLVPWIFLRGSYRVHTQNGVDFYSARLPSGVELRRAKTSDSDLAPFVSHEWGARIVLLLSSLTSLRRAPQIDLAYSRYLRSNNLQIHFFSLGYEQSF